MVCRCFFFFFLRSLQHMRFADALSPTDYQIFDIFSFRQLSPFIRLAADISLH